MKNVADQRMINKFISIEHSSLKERAEMTSVKPTFQGKQLQTMKKIKVTFNTEELQKTAQDVGKKTVNVKWLDFPERFNSRINTDEVVS
jgi:hypothetical protein